jgi:hypothetical protein
MAGYDTRGVSVKPVHDAGPGPVRADGREPGGCPWGWADVGVADDGRESGVERVEQVPHEGVDESPGRRGGGWVHNQVRLPVARDAAHAKHWGL